MPGAEGGLGSALVGDKITMGQLHLQVTKLLGEGGFSYVYLVKDVGETGLGASLHASSKQGNDGEDPPVPKNSGAGAKEPTPHGPMVLKVTSIHSRAQRDIAEKEAKLLSRLSHPSIIKMYDTCYRTVSQQPSGKRGKDAPSAGKERPQHLILMEFCEGGHALDVCNKLSAAGKRFDLSTLIIAFGQICNAVSYLHAQRPPIVHRDLKPVNFLVKNGAYKLCDFGSAVFGHVDLRTPKARADAEEIIEKTTTQMFRAPEMVDLYMAKKLTQATDVWALGCCLYSLAFLQNCFEEGSNLAILSRKYTIPEDNPYGDGLVELLDRMLTVDSKARADMTEVILCLSAVYSGRPLPPRKKPSRSSKEEKEEGKSKDAEAKKESSSDERIGKFRTDAQGYQENIYDPTKATEGKKLASNSVAARRKRAAASSAAAAPTKAGASAPAPAPASADNSTAADPLAFSALQGSEEVGAADLTFSSDFGDMKGFENSKGDDFFGSFDGAKEAQTGGGDGFDAAAFDNTAWGETAPSAENPVGDTQEEGKEADQIAFDQIPVDQATFDQPPVSNAPLDPPDADGVHASSESKRKDEPSDPHRKPSRRKHNSRSGRPRGIEAGVEGMKITDTENAGAEGEKKERRPRGSRDEEKDARKRSSSRSKRKARSQREPRPEKSEEAGATEASAPEKRAMRKGGSGTSFRNPFGRKDP